MAKCKKCSKLCTAKGCCMDFLSRAHWCGCCKPGDGKKSKLSWMSANVNEVYSDDANEGIKDMNEGDLVILLEDGTWYSI